MKTYELYEKLNELIPESLSCEWDNDGLSVLPDVDHESKKILISLDVRAEVIDYAIENDFDTIITHHPLIFSKLEELNGSSVPSKKVLRLVREDIAAMSFHTRFDAVEGGVSDVLCSFLGGLEPYAAFGEGNCGRLCNKEVEDFDSFAERLKNKFGSAHFFCEKATDTVERVAVCSGSGADFTSDALALGADTIVCGEMNYHSAIDAADEGLNVICVGHYESEVASLARLCELVSSVCDEYVEIYGVTQHAV